MRLRRLLVIAGLVSLTVPTSLAMADDPVGSLADLAVPSSNSGPVDSDLADLIGTDQRVTVMVQLADDPVAVVEAKNGGELDPGTEERLKSELRSNQERLSKAIQGLGGSTESQMQSAYNGMRVTIDANQLEALGKLDGVEGIHSIPRHERSNVVAVPYTGTPAAWASGTPNGYTGKGVKLAVVDTGIDYTHATFGGPGTAAAFAEATAVNDQSKMAGTRVKGGHDFAGDAYTGHNAPVPDDNPIDCATAGHGTHVAGTAAGSGVSANGTQYTGPYNADTFTNNDFSVGPGTAPEADIYALRVFGCDGSTDLVTEAMDWAVDNHMDVVNLSLGSSFGRSGEPDSEAVANAVAAGVVVVASAGNSGPAPYLTGSPGVAPGVVSVAANDPAEVHPGATLDVSGAQLQAINANNAQLPADGQLVVLRSGNSIATGCDAAMWGPQVQGKIVVTRRASCARTRRAVLGQQYGAKGVIMVNSTDSLPPFEGEINQDPESGDPVQVTIPFLGVKSSDGAALLAADGQQISLTAGPMANPGFAGFASFTSAGPRSGDSAVRPTVTAPGVSISSALVGSGTQAKVESGTSMASPYVAGIAALVRQAHPDWNNQEIASALVSTADSQKVPDYGTSRGGGLIDPLEAVNTSVLAWSDSTAVNGTDVRDPAISFGYAEFSDSWTGNRTVTLVNKGTSPVTLHGVVEASSRSLPASVSLGVTDVTIPAGGTATVPVTMSVKASDVPSSIADATKPNFYEVSGNVRFTDQAGKVLSLPYLLAPRSTSNVVGNQVFDTRTDSKVTFANNGGGVDARSMLFTWGLKDSEDVDEKFDVGQDLAAAGVASYDKGGNQTLAFALNSSSRFSNPASIMHSVYIDRDLDGIDDYQVFSTDSGLVNTQTANGVAAIFIRDLRTRRVTATGTGTLAPTDSSTVIMEVKASDIGVTGKFSYHVAASNVASVLGLDSIDDKAYYDPANKAFTDGQVFSVDKNASHEITINTNEAVHDDLGVLGYMLVVFDNVQGTTEAITGPVIGTPTPSSSPAPSSSASGQPSASASATPGPGTPEPSSSASVQPSASAQEPSASASATPGAPEPSKKRKMPKTGTIG